MILPKFIVRRSHGRQYIPDLDAVCLTEKFRGRPELTEPSDDEQRAALTRAAAICPTQAIAAAPFTLDMGRCLFCGECARIAPRAIRFTNDYRIGSPTREGLRLTPGMDRVPFDPAAVREQIVTTFGRALKLRQVSAGGDASVEMELNATGNVNFDFGRYGVEFTASPRHADGIVLTGPVTANMAEALDICYDAVAEPKLLIVCGSDACSGGLYAASRAVDRSFFERRHVDLWLPGAPTHPMTFIDGIRTMLRKDRETGSFEYAEARKAYYTERLICEILMALEQNAVNMGMEYDDCQKAMGGDLSRAAKKEWYLRHKDRGMEP